MVLQGINDSVKYANRPHIIVFMSIAKEFWSCTNEKYDNICNALVEELFNRQSTLELDIDPDPGTTLFLTFLSKVHGVILHNRYLRRNNILVVCTLLRKRIGIINDYSFAKFHQWDVSNWIQNKSKEKPFVNTISKRDHL